MPVIHICTYSIHMIDLYCIYQGKYCNRQTLMLSGITKFLTPTKSKTDALCGWFAGAAYLQAVIQEPISIVRLHHSKTHQCHAASSSKGREYRGSNVLHLPISAWRCTHSIGHGDAKESARKMKSPKGQPLSSNNCTLWQR